MAKHEEHDHAAEGEGEVCILPALSPASGGEPWGRTGTLPTTAQPGGPQAAAAILADFAGFLSLLPPQAASGIGEMFPTLKPYEFLFAGGPAGLAGPAEVLVPDAVVIDPNVNLGAVPAGGVGVTYGDTFKLHSNPGSSFKVYLDFDGHTTTGTSWNSYFGQTSFYSPAFSKDGSEAFTAAELEAIQQIWQRVAEYFSPFNLDVTTEDPGVAGLTYSGAGDTSFGIRVVITDEYDPNKAWGGIAYVGSFDWNSDTPTYVYSQRLGDNAKYIADAAAHEVGHTLGLSHDGQGTDAYYYGHGSGATGWAPVMGVGYYENIIQWSKGEYTGATQTQDDLAIITSQNSGVGYRTDDYGNGFSTAAALTGTVANGTATVATSGIITTTSDIDMFRLSVSAGGSINLTISSWTEVHVSGSATPTYDQSPFSMLDLVVKVYDGSQSLIATINDPARLDATVNLTGLAGGTYYISLDGTGFGDPLASSPTGYTEYGSLGQYMVRGTYSTGGEVLGPTGTLGVSPGSITTNEGGGAASFTVTLSGASATEAAAVTVTGLDGTEGSADPLDFVLTQAGNSAIVTVTGLDDRNADGNVTYTLQVSADGYTSRTVQVTNLDDDFAPVSAGAATGSYSKRTPGASNATVAALSADDGSAMTISEGTSGSVQRLTWEWTFSGLPTGDKLIQLDAASSNERFAFEYWNGTDWASIADGAAYRSAWTGDFLITAADGADLRIRVVDELTSGDKSRSSLSIDLLTVTSADPAAPDQIWMA